MHNDAVRNAIAEPAIPNADKISWQTGAIESEASARRKEIAMNELPTETQEQVIGVLGRAIVKLWSRLPHDVQQHLFEEAVRSQDQSVRQQVAVFLHHQHPRTSDSMRARAIPEPDSLGG
jgi:hypothetical protein